jgi:predicted DNA-binding transcriptional regulator YafY
MTLKWEVQKRLEEIEHCLFWGGFLSRGNLTNKFGISVQQASADISMYQSLAPDSINFNRSTRRYEPNKNFSPALIDPSISDYFEWKNNSVSKIEYVSMPLRNVELPSLRIIANTIYQNKSIEIDYQSMSTEKLSRRRITPHTVVFDGFRYHIRAYCHMRNNFRDFVLGRICRATNFDFPGKTKLEDDNWNTRIPLRLGTHPELTLSQRKIIEKDFGMKNGELILKVRLAMLHYTLTQLRIDRFSDDRSPAEQQIVLLNPDVLKIS